MRYVGALGATVFEEIGLRADAPPPPPRAPLSLGKRPVPLRQQTVINAASLSRTPIVQAPIPIQGQARRGVAIDAAAQAASRAWNVAAPKAGGDAAAIPAGVVAPPPTPVQVHASPPSTVDPYEGLPAINDARPPSPFDRGNEIAAGAADAAAEGLYLIVGGAVAGAAVAAGLAWFLLRKGKKR